MTDRRSRLRMASERDCMTLNELEAKAARERRKMNREWLLVALVVALILCLPEV